VEGLIKILEAAFGDCDEVRMAAAEWYRLSEGNHEFSIYYTEFQ
jgi:hypothetical protein